jgi:hypothetical protein
LCTCGTDARASASRRRRGQRNSAIALQIGLLVAVCFLPFVNWRRYLGRTAGP